MGTKDEDAIIATVMDYFEGWFDGDVTRMERAVHPDLAKRGIAVDESGEQIVAMMTAEQMIGWTRDGAGKAERPADLVIKVEVNDVHAQIATATVYGTPYIEYVHLVRTPERWRILNTVYVRARQPSGLA
jgi:hypothetical protein